MLTYQRPFLLALFALTALAGCAQGVKESPTSAAVDAALQLAAEKQWPQAESSLTALVNSRDFVSLPDSGQFRALLGIVRVESALSHAELEYRYLVRALKLPQAGFEQRRLRVNLATQLNNTKEAIEALTELARRDPDRLNASNADFISGIVNDASQLDNRSGLPLLLALFSAHWQPLPPLEPSTVWRDLALMLIAAHRNDEAAQVSTRITEPYVLVSMRADRRFDPITSTNSAQFDVERAAELRVRELVAASESMPTEMWLKVATATALLHHQHAAAALAVLDSVILELRSTNYPEKAYVDYKKQLPKLLEARAEILASTGAWDEALVQEIGASNIAEDNHDNVSQRINLGGLYVRCGRPLDALAALRTVTGTSDIGKMELEVVRLEAAEELSDRKQTTQSLDYIRAHRSVQPQTLEEALVAADQLGEAAQVLIERLRDPRQRVEALLGIQRFADSAMTDWDKEMSARSQLVLDREDVKSAVSKVGRIERYQLTGD